MKLLEIISTTRFILGVLSLNLFFILLFFILGTYPLPIIFLHFLSLVYLFFYAIDYRYLFGYLTKHKSEILIVFFLFLSAFLIRSYQIDVVTPGVQGDEIIAGQASLALSHMPYAPFIFSNAGHGTLLPYLFGLSLTLLGKTVFALRLPAIFFGALGTVTFYILLRVFFQKRYAVPLSFLFVVSYAHIALSRLAFESSASLFFQIMSFIFLFLLIQRKKTRYAIGLGIMLGLGNYTYLDFRLFTLLMIGLITGWSIYQRKFSILFYTVLSFIAAAAPLIHYAIVHINQFAERSRELSIFGIGYSPMQLFKNLLGNIAQLYKIVLPPGDPNGRVNPGNTSLVDGIISISALGGIIYLFRKEKIILLMTSLFFIPPILSDIFSEETGPANTFYGFAHPNTMRIEGVIPLLYFLAAFGIYSFQRLLKHTTYEYFLPICLILFSGMLMYFSYFNQPYNGYTYYVDGTPVLFVTHYLNANKKLKNIYISSTFAKDDRLIFFIYNDKHIHIFSAQSLQQALQQINASDITILDPNSNTPLVQQIFQYQGNGLLNYDMQVNKNPLGDVDSIMFERIVN